MKSHLLTFLAVTVVGGFLIGFGCTNSPLSEGYIAIEDIDSGTPDIIEGERIKFTIKVLEPTSCEWAVNVAADQVAFNFSVAANSSVSCEGDNHDTVPTNVTCCIAEAAKSIICNAPQLPQGFGDTKSYEVKATVVIANQKTEYLSRLYTVQKLPLLHTQFTVSSLEENRWDTSDVQRQANTFFKGEQLRLEATGFDSNYELAEWRFDPEQTLTHPNGNDNKGVVLFRPQNPRSQQIVLTIKEKANTSNTDTSNQTINISLDKFMNCEPASDFCGPVDTVNPPLAASFTVCATGVTPPRCGNDLIPGEAVTYHFTGTGNNITQYELSELGHPPQAELDTSRNQARFKGINYKGFQGPDAVGVAPRDRGVYIAFMRVTDDKGNRSAASVGSNIGGNFYANFEMGYKTPGSLDFKVRPQNVFAADDILQFRNSSQCDDPSGCTYEWHFIDAVPTDYSASTAGWNDANKTYTGQLPPPTAVETTTGGSHPAVQLTMTGTNGRHDTKTIEFTIGNPTTFRMGLAVEVNGRRVEDACPSSSSLQNVVITTSDQIRLDLRPGALTGEIDPTTGKIVTNGGTLRNLKWQLGCKHTDANGQRTQDCSGASPVSPTISCNSLQDPSCATKIIYLDRGPGGYRIDVTATKNDGTNIGCSIYLNVTQGTVQNHVVDFNLDSTVPPATGYTGGLNVRYGNNSYTIITYSRPTQTISMTLKTFGDATNVPQFGTLPYTYTWTTSRGIGVPAPLAGGNGSSFTVNQLPGIADPEIFNVWLIVTDQNGVTVSRMKNVTVRTQPEGGYMITH